ncbi:MAG TPA: NUDIX hydrolase [bacterium]|nr:NUDIX hydrolase [bacterium]
MRKKKPAPRRTAKRARAPKKRRPRRHLKMAGPILERRSEPTVPHPLPVDPPRGLVSEWTRVASEEIGDYRIFKVRRDVSVHPRTNTEHRFVVLEGGDWVNVIPITDDGKVVFVEQFRHGVRANTLEVPGGMVDAGESPSQAAARELLEETGYAGGAPVELGWIHPNPAIQDNRCWSYIVRGARRVAPAHTEGTEDIAVLEIPLRDVPRLIAAGRITHALVVVAFQWLWLREGR